MKKIPLAFFVLCSIVVSAQPPMTWQHCTGGTDGEQSVYVIATHDKGFIVAGVTSSTDGDILTNHGSDDAILIRFDSLNNLVWKKTYGGSLDEYASAIIETADHGFVFVGNTESSDGDVAVNHGEGDIWVVRIDSSGTIIWEKTFGDTTYDEAWGIIQNAAGNFIITGGISDANWDEDYALLNIDPNGNLVWQKTFGGSYEELAYTTEQTNDGGYIISGGSYSTDGDITNNHGDRDVWIVKTDGNGNLQWQKSYGGSDDDITDNIVELANGSFVFGADAWSSDGDVLNSHGGPDYWVVKIDQSGNILNQKCYGGTDMDEAFRLIQTSDNGFLISGSSASNDGDVHATHGDMDAWTVKIDSTFALQWAVSSGGSAEELAYGIAELGSGDYVLTGYSFSNDGNVSGNHGGGFEDIWTFRLSGNGNYIDDQAAAIDLKCFPNPVLNNLRLQYFLETASDVVLTIYDLPGRKLYEGKIASAQGFNSEALDLSGLESGQYYISLRLKEGIAVKRFVKE